MSDCSSKCTVYLDTWMGDLPSCLKKVPLMYLAIPGSHNSMSYGIKEDNGLAPGTRPILKRLYPLFKGTFARWTVTQSLDTWQQLKMGIRYFDLKFATKVGEENFYFTNCLYAEEISTALLQVKKFVDTHPEEVVILDCQHFFGFTPEDHQRLIRYLLNMFQSRLVAWEIDQEKLTLEVLHRLKIQVIIVYHNAMVRYVEMFWPRPNMPSLRPRQKSVARLLWVLRHGWRQPHTAHVHQVVLTPSASFIMLRLLSNLREKCALPVVNQVLPKLAEFMPGPPLPKHESSQAPINVVIADFIDIDNGVFCKTIIELNMKLVETYWIEE